MRIITEQELDKFSFYLIGTEDRHWYFPAIIGLAKDSSHVAYSVEKLAECFMKQNGWTWDEAVEWIAYNVERALPYYGDKAPVILESNRIQSKNKYYDAIKLVPHRYYISGAVSSDSDFREKFSKAEKELTDRGYDVLNPVKDEEDGKDWSYYMKKDLVKLTQCSALVRLPDWKESSGARLEYDIAVKLGYRIVDLEDLL